MRKGAVVEGEVGEETCFFVGAVGFDEGAFVVGEVDEPTLWLGLACCYIGRGQSSLTSRSSSLL